VQQTVDDVVIVARGRLVRAGTLAELAGVGAVRALTPDAPALVAALAGAGIEASAPLPGEVLARGTTPAAVGHVAFTARIELHELGAAASDLETIFLRMVDGSAPPSGPAAPPPAAPPPAAPPPAAPPPAAPAPALPEVSR
jgi:ABC-2 type transport system ATP-binding protein